MTENEIKIKEFKKINLEGGYLIDGFPSVGFSSAIATESMIHTSQFELGGIIDSEIFPPISVIKNGKPNYPSRIFINEDLKVGVFSSYLNLDQSLHRQVSDSMLQWAKTHKIKLIVSSVAIKSEKENSEMMGVGSTDSARKKIEEAGFVLSKKSEINANSKDTKDHPNGVWTLPPTLYLKDGDKEKYRQIGESDRMTLLFKKPI